MLKKTCAFLLALCLLLTVCGCDGGAGAEANPSPSPSRSAVPEASPAPEETPAAQLSQRAENWAADISYLKRNYKMYHPDPFYLCSEEEFNWKLDQLVAKVDDLSDNDIYFELAAIIAGMGDIHTAVVAPDSLFDREFPVLVRCFGDKPYLYGYLEGTVLISRISGKRRPAFQIHSTVGGARHIFRLPGFLFQPFLTGRAATTRRAIPSRFQMRTKKSSP